MLNDYEFHEDFVDDNLKEAVLEEETTQEHNAPSVHSEVVPEEENEPDRGSPFKHYVCHALENAISNSNHKSDAQHKYVSRASNQCVF